MGQRRDERPSLAHGGLPGAAVLLRIRPGSVSHAEPVSAATPDPRSPGHSSLGSDRSSALARPFESHLQRIAPGICIRAARIRPLVATGSHWQRLSRLSAVTPDVRDSSAAPDTAGQALSRAASGRGSAASVRADSALPLQRCSQAPRRLSIPSCSRSRVNPGNSDEESTFSSRSLSPRRSPVQRSTRPSCSTAHSSRTPASA